MSRKHRILTCAIVLLAGCAGLLALLLPNLAEPPATEPLQETRLEFYQQREEAINAFSAVLDSFALEHSEGVIVQNRVANSLEYLSARIQRSDMPDLFTHWPTQVSFTSAVSSGVVLSLDGQSFLDRVNEDALALCRESSGGIYALPINRNCMEVYYNADLFKQFGLSEPETLDELLQICAALSSEDHTPLIFYIRDNRTAHIAQAMMAALNDDYLSLLGQLANGTIASSDRTALLETLRLLRRLYLDYSDQNAGYTFYEACEKFAKGESAMIITGSYALSMLRGMNPDFEMSAFAFPGTDADSKTLLTSIDTAVCLSADCADADLALAFLEYLTRDDVISLYVAQDGAPSCIKGVYQDDPITQKMQQQISNYENAEWIKSCYSLESCLTFENAISSYMISGNELVLLEELTSAFAKEPEQ